MGKRIISQARGKGSLTYRVRRKAYMHKTQYPMHEGEAKIVKLVHSAGHSAPLAELQIQDETFYNPAFNGAVVGETVSVGESKDPKAGDILPLKSIPLGSQVFNVERNPGDGGKMKRSAGTSATVFKKYPHNKISILADRKREIKLSGDCRATIGVVAGSGRVQKPFIKAGKKHYKMKARNKLWPRTSAVKMNPIDHPFGSGRGKVPKSKIPKKDASPGRKVGTLTPKRTGRKKR